jgi:hypothetical protein
MLCDSSTPPTDRPTIPPPLRRGGQGGSEAGNLQSECAFGIQGLFRRSCHRGYRQEHVRWWAHGTPLQGRGPGQYVSIAPVTSPIGDTDDLVPSKEDKAWHGDMAVPNGNRRQPMFPGCLATLIPNTRPACAAIDKPSVAKRVRSIKGSWSSFR